MGVEILLNQQVKNYENNMLVLDDGNFIESANVYWVAGVKANSLAGLPAECYGPGNRLRVNEHNQIQDFKNIFAIGDTALMISEEYPKGHPQVVQPAIQQAMNLIKNLRNIEKGQPLIPFKYYNKGSMATIGRNNAVVELQKIRFQWISRMGSMAIYTLDEHSGGKKPFIYFYRLDVELFHLRPIPATYHQTTAF